MAFNLDDKHLVEINRTSILEPVDEVFDGITSLLTDNAVMYGSTVTAILAGLPIVGDLDIAVSAIEHPHLTQKIASSVKWLQVDGKTIPERKAWRSDGIVSQSAPSLSSPFKNPYKDAKHLPISDVIVFKTVNDSRVQIMRARKASGDPLEDALDVVRKVDFAFCGMALDKWGRLLETIPHAYADCLDRNIRIVDYQARLDPDRLVYRIRKYTGRGWNLTFSIDQAKQNIKRAKLAALSAPKKKKKHTFRLPSLFRIKKDPQKGPIIELKNSVINMVEGSKDKCRDVVRHYGNDIGIKLEVIRSPFGMQFFSAKGQLDMARARNIIDSSTRYFKRNYNVTPETLRDREKEGHSSREYGSKYGYPGGSVKYKSGGYGFTGGSKYTTS